MPIVPTQEILGRAFRDRYGVAAINIVNDLTLEAVLEEVDADVVLFEAKTEDRRGPP